MKKRVLLYNWTQFDDSKGRGGGVSVYLKSIIPEYLKNDVEVVFLSSGCHYSLLKRGIFTRATDNLYSGLGVKTYEIVNSPIKAPSADSFYQIKECLENEEIASAFLEFVDSRGPFDEVHFHNIEGISTKTIQWLKKACNSKIVVWFHNYHWVCPQIELFNKHNLKCIDYRGGVNCSNCIGRYRDTKKKILIQRVVSFLELNIVMRGALGKLFDGWLRAVFIAFRSFVFFSYLEKIGRKKNMKSPGLNRSLPSNANYREWREQNVGILNKSADVCIAVSDLAKENIVNFGLEHQKVQVVPLGMDVYKTNFVELGQKKTREVSLKIKVGFLGYGTVAKGLPFVCDAIEQLDDNYRSKFSFHIYSRLNKQQKSRIEPLSEILDLHLIDGYKRADLKSICENIDVVIVPSVWWETFNQVSYEMVMNGVPIMISNSVGIAKYLPEKFHFNSGDTESFLELLKKILDDPNDLNMFWQKDELNLQSLEEHYHQLCAVV